MNTCENSKYLLLLLNREKGGGGSDFQCQISKLPKCPIYIVLLQNLPVIFFSLSQGQQALNTMSHNVSSENINYDIQILSHICIFIISVGYV